MYIGIHINNAFMATATTDQNNKAVLIKDENTKSDKPFVNPLKIYIEDEFAYLGDTINYLLANNYDLSYASGFLEALADIEKPVYKDGSGTDWNAAAILAVFLKKIKTDLQIYDDSPVAGAVVTVSARPEPSLIEALKSTFNMANIPLEAVLDMEKAAMEGYHIINTANTTKYILLYYLDPYECTLSLNSLDEDDFMKNICRVSEKKLGEQQLHDRLFSFLIKRYEHITGKKIKANKQSFLHIETLVHKLVAHTVNDNKLYVELLLAIDDEVIELIVTRAQVNAMIKEYIQESMMFLKNEVLKDHIDEEVIDMVLCTGDSKLFPLIEQQLNIIFHKEEQRIYNLSPEEVLTKGAALYANNPDKAADTSLLTDIVTESHPGAKTHTETEDSGGENTPDIAELIKRISNIHINDLGERI